MGAVLTFLSTLFVFSVVNGTPLLYGTLGEILTEKSGNMNLGVEGCNSRIFLCGNSDKAPFIAARSPWHRAFTRTADVTASL